MKKDLGIIIFVLLIVGTVITWQFKDKKTTEVVKNVSNVTEVNNFEDCVRLGNPVMESYPRQCNANGKNFVENIGNSLEKKDLIHLTTPLPNETITSPLTIKGEARGPWFFEASFPVLLTDWDGLIIGQGVAKADGDWMTSEFVPFTVSIEFKTSASTTKERNNGSLILRKDNPSGLPEHDDALEIPIKFDVSS